MVELTLSGNADRCKRRFSAQVGGSLSVCLGWLGIVVDFTYHNSAIQGRRLYIPL
jgi:hypothetical protein